MSEEINEFEKELKEITSKLAELKAITKDKMLKDLVSALSDVLNNTWNGYIKIRTYNENCVFELYEGNTYVAQFEIPCNQPILTFKEQLKQNSLKIILNLLYRITNNLKFLEENKIPEKIEELEEKIAELEDP